MKIPLVVDNVNVILMVQHLRIAIYRVVNAVVRRVLKDHFVNSARVGSMGFPKMDVKVSNVFLVFSGVYLKILFVFLLF